MTIAHPLTDAAGDFEIRITEGRTPEDWGSSFCTGVWSGFGQTEFRASFLSTVERAKPLFVEVYLDGRRVAGGLVMRRFLHKRGWPGRLPWYPNLECQDGPVVHQEPFDVGCLMAFFEWLRNYSSRIGALGIKGAFSHTSPSTDDAVSEMLTGLGYRVTTHATFLVDLQVAQNELWEGVDRSVRKNVRKCEKSAASVHLIRHADEFRHLFYATYRESENQAGRHCVPFSSFAPLMGPLLRPQYDFFVACSDDGVPLATLGVYYHDGTATEMASTLTQFALKEKIPAQDLLHWEVLKHAKSRGMHTFDLAGVNPNPVSPKEVGILRFKGKWGGTSRQFLTYTYDGSSQFARLFRMLKNAVRRVSGSHR